MLTIFVFLICLLIAIFITYNVTKIKVMESVELNSAIYQEDCEFCKKKDVIQFTAIAFIPKVGNLCQVWECVGCEDDVDY